MKMESNYYKMSDYESSNDLDSVHSRSGNGSNGRRKMSRWDPTESPNRSTGSLLTTMEKFVQTVDDMNETILVPCRLMDAKFDSPPATLHPLDPKARLLTNLNGVDLFQFYSVINTVKNDLMWGSSNSQPTTVNSHPGCCSAPNLSVLSTQSSSPSSASNTSSNGVKGHARRPSSVSTTSSTSASDTEFSELNEDSGVEGEEEYSQHIADSFHHHLNGLQQCLRELTLAANYVTNRYNNDLGGGAN